MVIYLQGLLQQMFSLLRKYITTNKILFMSAVGLGAAVLLGIIIGLILPGYIKNGKLARINDGPCVHALPRCIAEGVPGKHSCHYFLFHSLFLDFYSAKLKVRHPGSWYVGL